MNPEVIGTWIGCLVALGGLYKFLESRIKSAIEELRKLMDQNLINVKSEIDDLHDIVRDADHRSREIEQNYNKKFQETNGHISKTREDMLTGFGKLEVMIQSIQSTLKKES